MKWKDVILGSVITLVVTIIGGIIVYYVTKEPKQEKSEKILYSIEPAVRFETTTNKIAISNIRIANLGNLTAKNIRIVVELPSGIKILDKTVTNYLGGTEDIKFETESETKLVASMTNLLPDEVYRITLLLNSVTNDPLKVTIKSDSSIGTEGSLIQNIPAQLSPLDKILFFLLPILLILQISLGLLATKLWRERPYKSSLNNSAFVLLHKGLTEKAKQLLQKAIENGEAKSYELSNYALCLAVEGDFESAYKYIEAASIFDTRRYPRAIILFNSGLVKLLNGQIEQGIIDLRDSIKLKEKDITTFLKYSSIFSNLKQQHPILTELVLNGKLSLTDAT